MRAGHSVTMQNTTTGMASPGPRYAGSGGTGTMSTALPPRGPPAHRPLAANRRRPAARDLAPPTARAHAPRRRRLALRPISHAAPVRSLSSEGNPRNVHQRPRLPRRQQRAPGGAGERLHGTPTSDALAVRPSATRLARASDQRVLAAVASSATTDGCGRLRGGRHTRQGTPAWSVI